MADSILGRLIYKITGDVSDLQKSLKNTEKQINNFTKFVKSAAGLFGAAAAFSTLTRVVKDLAQAGLEEIQSEAKLTAAMKISGQTAQGQTKQLLGLAQALSMTTTWTHEETQDAMTTLTQIGRVSASGMRTLIPLVQDMATGMGVDLQTAASAVAKAMSGSNGALQRMGIHIKQTSDPTERFNSIVAALTQNFGGMSEEMARTAGGGLKQITMQFDELKEAVGVRLLQAFQGTIAGLASFMKAGMILEIPVKDIGSREEATAYIKTLQREIARIRGDLEKMKNMPGILRAPKEIEWQTARIAELQNKIEAIVRWQRNWKDPANDPKPVIEGQTGAVDGLTDAIKGELAAGDKLLDLYDRRKQAAQREAQDAARVEKETLDQVAEGRRNAADAAAAYWQSIADEVKQNNEQIVKNHQDLLDRVEARYGVLIGAASSAWGSIFSEMGAALAQGTLDWDTFAEAGVRGIGRIVSAIGDQLNADAAATLVRAIANSLDPLMWWAAPGEYTSAGIKAAGAAAAYVTGAYLENMKFATGGEFTVPPGHPGDSYPMFVQSGEHVSVTPAGGGGRGGPVIYQLVLNGRVLSEFTQKELDDRRILVGKGSLKR